MPRPSYGTEASHWRAYQPHLPPQMRLVEGRLPREEWWSWRGQPIHLDRYSDPDATATVMVLHGGGGYGRMLATVGRALHEQGHEVVLPDLPGYGLSPSPAGGLRYDDWVRCVVGLIAHERALGRAVVLLGMSMGGMLALHAAAAAPDPVDGVIATTLMDPRRPEVRRGAGRVPTPKALLRVSVADRVRVPMPLLAPIEKMSSVPAINRLCLRDPQGGGRRVPFGLLRTWMTYEPAVEPRAFDRCPVLLAHPLADRWTPLEWSTTVLEEIAGPTRFIGLENCEHWPIEEPGCSTFLTESARAVTEWTAAKAKVA